jgi:uroporphyrin-III C-methyltransferase/precorrin-2 dehydrogenase/sirohydrochlorin ferrochelatase
LNWNQPRAVDVEYLPLFIDLRGGSCLVVGGGEVALRKIRLLLRAGAAVEVIAPEICDAIGALAQAGSLHHLRRSFEPADVSGRVLVVAATDDARVNAEAHAAAGAAGVLINSVDDPSLSSAIFPSIIDRDPVLVAVSTGGRSPTLARFVRGWIEERLPARLGVLAEFLHAHRRRVQERLHSPDARQKFWQRAIESDVGELAMAGRTAQADAAFRELLEADIPRGSVTLIGAGPGDPELLTLKGLRALRRADVVLYDNLVSREILDYARRDAELVYVGKKRRFTSTRQEAINEALITHANSGRDVVRLKGGDPFIFGRGGEEIETLAEQGIGCTVIPGITAALGSASYAGVPLTYRGVAQSVRLVTGHRANDEVNVNWDQFNDPTQTLVIYMGLLGLTEITERLIGAGMSTETPALLIERATLSDQREVEATLATLAVRATEEDIRGPTIVIIGEVVRYRVTSPNPVGQ